jgi:glutathione S-transferase
MQLYIGNKNYSSWSLRAWLALRQLGVAFDEVKVWFGEDFEREGSKFKTKIGEVSPAGRVPVLVDDGFAVWDTLAILEYVNEKLPQARVWPADAKARARARCLAAEMHSGFGALRNHCPMNIEADLREVGQRMWSEHADIQRDLKRIETMWREQLERSGGPFLFGAFGAVDAYFAPVAARCRSYGLPLSEPGQRYAERIFELPAMQTWIADALAEHRFVVADEPYRKAPG